MSTRASVMVFLIILILVLPTLFVVIPRVQALSYPTLPTVGISYEETSNYNTPPITQTPEGHMRLWYQPNNPNSVAMNVYLGASIQIGSNTYSDSANDKIVTLGPGANSVSRYFYVPAGVPSGSYTVIYAIWDTTWSTRYASLSKSGWVNMVSSVSVQLSSSPSNIGTITWDNVVHSLPYTAQTTTRMGHGITCTPPTGYLFDHWENTGAVRAWDASSQSTNVAVDGSGSLTTIFKLGPTFNIVAASQSLSLQPSGSTTDLMTITSQNSFSGSISLSLGWGSGRPTWITRDDFSSNPASVSSGGTTYSTLTLAVSSAAVAGTYYPTVWAISGSITKSIPLTLTVQPPPTASININPNGGRVYVDSSPITSQTSYTWTIGSTHQLDPETGYSPSTGTQLLFVQWNDGNTADPRSIVVSSSTTYTVSWQYKYQLTIAVNPPGAGTTNPTGSPWYNSGTAVQVSQSSLTGYVFDYWNLDGTNVGTNQPYTVTMNAPHALTAYYKPSGTLTITGWIQHKDENGNPANSRYIKVEAWEKNVILDYEIAEGYTDNNGHFTFTRDMNNNPILNEDPGLGESGTRDIYIKYFAENEAARVTSTWVSNWLGDTYSGSTSVDYDVPSPVWTINVYVTSSNSPALGIPGYIKDDRDWLLNTVHWSREQVGVLYPADASFHPPSHGQTPAGDWAIFLPDVTDPVWNTLPPFQYVLTHEYGHAIQFSSRGNNMPDQTVGPNAEAQPGGTHYIYSESSNGMALVEGWANFFLCVRHGDYWSLSSNDYWMGDDGNGPSPPNPDGTTGEIVEGAFASVLWHLYDGNTANFQNIWTVFLSDQPDRVWTPTSNDDFYHYWITRFGHTRAVDEIFIDQGMPVIDDPYDSGSGNDDSAHAANLGTISTVLSLNDLISTDTDWYRFSISTTGDANSNIMIQYDSNRGKLDFAVYRQDSSLFGFGTLVSGGRQLSLNGAPPGIYTIVVYGSGDDLSTILNEGDYSPNYRLQITPPTPDVSPPSTPTPDDGINGWSNNNMPSFSWSSSTDSGSGVAGYYWKVDSGSESGPVSSGFTIPAQPDGSHTFYVRAKDNAGNYGAYGSHVFQIDTVVPSTPGPDDGVSGWSNNNRPTFSWSSSSDALSGVKGYWWKVDSGSESWTTSTSVTVPPQPDGSHTFFVRAQDNAGNNGNYGSHDFNIVTTQFDFAFNPAPSPSSQTVTAGGSTTYQIYVQLTSGVTQSVSLSCSPSITGVTYSFSPQSSNPTFSSTLTVQTSSNTPANTYTLTITGTGGQTHTTTVQLIVNPPSTGEFDFGTASSPVASGYVRVTESTGYSAGLGYGWDSRVGLGSRDRGAPDDLRRDLVFSSADHTFNVDLTNGNYKVTLIIGDQSYLHDLIDAYAEGVLQVNHLTVSAGTFSTQVFTVTVNDGQLNIKFHKNGGLDGNWVINSIIIEPTA
jgi:hypothetical protein